MMTTFKTLATLILVGIIGMALFIGPLPDSPDGKGTPGQQSPPEPGMVMEAPAPSPLLAVGLILGTVVLAFRLRAANEFEF